MSEVAPTNTTNASRHAVQSSISYESLSDNSTCDDCSRWLTRQLNRPPESYDLYAAGKALYQLGRYMLASKLLELYVSGSGHERPGPHLLGYAYALSQQQAKAVEQLVKVVNSGFDSDWQLLVECAIDVERQSQSTAVAAPPS